MMDGIAACVFDAYGTLFDVGAAVEHCRASLGEQRAQALIALWRSKQLEYSWLRSLMGRHEDFWHITGDSLDHAMATLGVDDPHLRCRLMETYLAPRPFSEVPAMLEALRAGGMRSLILSNGTPLMLTSAVRFAGLERHIHAALSVEAVGVYKPHPSVYQLAVERLGLAPETIAFCSSNAWDVAGAAAFGLRVVWINRRNAPPEQLPGEAEVVLPDLSDLPGLLGL
jgi:2-haloacid dehalogenase